MSSAYGSHVSKALEGNQNELYSRNSLLKGYDGGRRVRKPAHLTLQIYRVIIYDGKHRYPPCYNCSGNISLAFRQN